MNEQQNIHNFQAAVDAGRALGAPILPPEATSVVVIPNGYQVKDLESVVEKYLAVPRRVKATPRFATLDSFIAFVNEYKQEQTKIFALLPGSKHAPAFTAVFDYHSALKNGHYAAWCEFRAQYNPEFTEEWKRWMAADKKRMSQTEFAEFLEENASLVKSPLGAELLELVQTLEGTSNVSINSAVKLQNGRVKLNYNEEIELKGSVSTKEGSLEVPQFINVAIQPFDGGPAYNITCRLRYRIDNRKITFWFECVDVHLILKDVVTGIVEQISDKTKIDPLQGTI